MDLGAVRNTGTIDPFVGMVSYNRRVGYYATAVPQSACIHAYPTEYQTHISTLAKASLDYSSPPDVVLPTWYFTTRYIFSYDGVYHTRQPRGRLYRKKKNVFGKFSARCCKADLFGNDAIPTTTVDIEHGKSPRCDSLLISACNHY